MNERIKLLADQAGLRFTQLMSNPMVPVVSGKETDLAKFAELIVKECAEHLQSSVLVPNIEHSRTKTKCIRAIKEHFGVEE